MRERGKLLRKSGYPCLVLGDVPDVLSKKKKKINLLEIDLVPIRNEFVCWCGRIIMICSLCRSRFIKKIKIKKNVFWNIEGMAKQYYI